MRNGSREPVWNFLVIIGGKKAVKLLKYQANLSENLFLCTEKLVNGDKFCT